MRIITIILFLGLAVPSFTASVASFRKEKAKLVEYKKKCERKDEPDRSECLEKYEKKKAKYKKKLAKFKQRSGLEDQKRQERKANSSPKSIQKDIQNRDKSIESFTKFVEGSCVSKTNSRCALAYYQLADMTYKNEEDAFRILQTQYEKDMQKWEDHDQRGPEPTSPKREHAKSKEYFGVVLDQYPKYQDIPVVYFRLAFIESIQGNDDKAFKHLDKLVKGYPDHGLVVPAQLRIGEHWYMLRKYKKAIAAYEKIPDSYGGKEAALALYHKAECYYNMADFKKAARLYYDYVIKADAGKIDKDLRDEAMEFMAACWADIDGGVSIAHKFLKGKGHSWEKDVYYTIGEKNLSHDRLEQSREAFRHLLDIDPNYPKAPQADIAIVKTLVIEKRADEAQKARIDLVARYEGNSEWAQANSGNKKGRDEAEKAVKSAMFQIPVYYHHKATKNKKKPDKGMLAEAQTHYQNYLNRYDGHTWEVYETHQNLGAISHLLGQYSEAASEYKWCANAPVKKYGKKPKDKKKSLLTRADAFYNLVYMLDLDRQKMVKSMGDKKEQAYTKPQTVAYMSAVDDYMKEYGNSNSAPDISYNAALVHYEAKQYEKAVNALQDLREKFKNHKHSNLIRRMLGQSLLESGKYAESEQVFAELLKKTNRSAKEYKDIELSVASAIFKQADKLNGEGEHKQAAEAYLRVVKKYSGVNIADKALFEAGAQFEEAGDVTSATETFISLHTRFPKSNELKIKAILRAASIYRKNERFKESAETFLIVRNKFPEDTNAFASIGWAAEAYTDAKSLAMAAKTYESAHKYFPKHQKTPSFVYNAGQTYEELKDWGNAIRVYKLLGSKYKKSNFAMEALFSVPLIQEKRGNFSQAASAYNEFISKYNNDPQKLIRAQLAAGKIYDDKLNKKEKALGYFNDVRKTFENNKQMKIPSAIPAEAAYRAGAIYFTRVDSRKLNAGKKTNAKRLKEMAADLQTAVGHFSFALEQSEQEWTLRSTLKMGDLFMSMARITSEEKITAKKQDAIMQAKISMLRGLPGLYDNAKSIYQKNLDLSREQGIKGNDWITETEEKYMTTYQLKARVFIDIGIILSNAPMPPDLTPEEAEEYKAILGDKKYEMEQAAKGPLATGLKAAQFYSIDNEVTSQIKSMLADIDPEAPELSLKQLTAAERNIVFVDDVYKANAQKIAEIYNSSDSDKAKISKFNQIETAAKAEVERLLKELDQSGSSTGGTAQKPQ